MWYFIFHCLFSFPLKRWKDERYLWNNPKHGILGILFFFSYACFLNAVCVEGFLSYFLENDVFLLALSRLIATLLLYNLVKLIVRVYSLQMNQLQSELKLARSLIAERDSEVQRVRATNDQVFLYIFYLYFCQSKFTIRNHCFMLSYWKWWMYDLSNGGKKKKKEDIFYCFETVDYSLYFAWFKSCDMAIKIMPRSNKAGHHELVLWLFEISFTYASSNFCYIQLICNFIHETTGTVCGRKWKTESYLRRMEHPCS